MTQKPFLEVKNLNVAFPTEDGLVQASNDISFTVARGETLAVVGESGSGKSVTSLAVMGLHDRKRTKISGQAFLNLESGPVDVISADEEVVRKLRGKAMSMIFQDPLTSLTPHMTVGAQMREILTLHQGLKGEAANKRCVEWLEHVRIPEAARRLDQFPHELSGGMRQRVMIAIAMLCGPKLLIADELTTALDVTVQAQVLDLLQQLVRAQGAAALIITHDLGIVAQYCDDMAIMFAGRVVERGPVAAVFADPRHPYTQRLIAASRARIGTDLTSLKSDPPDLFRQTSACVYADRCDRAQAVCQSAPIERPCSPAASEHRVLCHLTPIP